MDTVRRGLLGSLAGMAVFIALWVCGWNIGMLYISIAGEGFSDAMQNGLIRIPIMATSYALCTALLAVVVPGAVAGAAMGAFYPRRWFSPEGRG